MKLRLMALLVILLTGCWTFNESEFPHTVVTPAKDGSRGQTLQLTGFSAMLTEYQAVHGFQTVYVQGSMDYCYGHTGYFQTVPTTSYMAQSRASDIYRRRAIDGLEKAGYTIAPANADFIVDMAFEGPYQDNYDALKEFTWKVCTIFFCDYSTIGWNGKLRIREAKTGKLLFSRDYSQRYEVNAAGIIPVFSIAHCAATKYSSLQAWCLSALTDQAVADAAAFISNRLITSHI